MSELNVTAFVTRYSGSMEQFSASVFESGLQNIGQVTWRNAMAAMADESEHLTSDLEALRGHFAECGAWERDELEAMSAQELNALLVQFVAGDYRELEGRETDDESDSGRLVQGTEGRWFYYLDC